MEQRKERERIFRKEETDAHIEIILYISDLLAKLWACFYYLIDRVSLILILLYYYIDFKLLNTRHTKKEKKRDEKWEKMQIKIKNHFKKQQKSILNWTTYAQRIQWFLADKRRGSKTFHKENGIG